MRMIRYGGIIYKMDKQSRHELRYEMVQFAIRQGNKASARAYETSAKVVRKWVKRFEEEGLSGLKDRSRRPINSPNKCSPTLEKKIIKLRIKTKHKFGARRLIDRFDLNCGKSCVQRIIKEHHLVKKRKKKRQKRNELWSVKKLMKVFEKIQIDVKELTDIPLYFSAYSRLNLPKYEFTARCVKTGAAFVCFAQRNTSTNAAIFALYLFNHLKAHGFDVSTIEVQTDNGSEFNAAGRKKTGNMPIEFVIKEVFQSSIGYIPPASPTFNSDVETFHRLVEDEFYAIEPVSSLDCLLRKMYTFLIDFNYIRKNSYKDNKTPFELASDDKVDFSKQFFNLPPVLLEDHYHLYRKAKGLEYDSAPPVTKLTGGTDPLLDDPTLAFFAQRHSALENYFEPLGGNNVSGLHRASQNL